jgi:CHAD domain-containing protein
MKKLTKYLKKRKTTIDFLLKTPENKYTSITFHKLRVEIKKLNSLFDLINICSTNFKRKITYKPFKSIFRQAGKVRELQIEDAMLKNYFENKVIKDYSKSLKKLRLEAEEDFFLLLNKKLMNQLNKKYHSIIPHLREINQKKLSTYLEKKEIKIQELLGQEIIQTEQIHTLRKELKILNYNKTITNEEKPEENLSKQQELPELLGKWHDRHVIIKHLKKALKQGQISPTEANQLKIIQSKIANESHILLNEIKNAIAGAGVFGSNI